MKMHRDYEILCEVCQEAARRLVAENPNATEDEFIELAIYDALAWDYDCWEDNQNFDKPLSRDDADWIADMIFDYILSAS